MRINTLSLAIRPHKIPLAVCWTFLVVSAIMVAVLLFARTEQIVGFLSTYKLTPMSRIRKAFRDWQSCMTIRLGIAIDKPKKLWKELEKITKYCTSHTEVHRINLTQIKNKDEVKTYILSRNVRSFILIYGMEQMDPFRELW
ncbi:hypothetical protein GCK32_019426 [Trichostrongylus colubriformis]|uniref:Uncharacterized protein n=1 Tax=Trichostrongylus colubriformis TaxID=6319 RepID=A0AAN8IVT3_TRICO